MTTKRREPTTPGEILEQEFLLPLGLTQKQLADHLDCDVKVINRIVNGRTGVTAEMALKLGAALKTSAEFWLNAQKAVDLHVAAARLGQLPRALKTSILAQSTAPARHAKSRKRNSAAESRRLAHRPADYESEGR